MTGGGSTKQSLRTLIYQSLLLCWYSYYVIVAWIWSLIWYLGLDPIKWMMMYALNEDGWRDAKAHKAAKQVCTASTQS